MIILWCKSKIKIPENLKYLFSFNWNPTRKDRSPYHFVTTFSRNSHKPSATLLQHYRVTSTNANRRLPARNEFSRIIFNSEGGVRFGRIGEINRRHLHVMSWRVIWTNTLPDFVELLALSVSSRSALFLLCVSCTFGALNVDRFNLICMRLVYVRAIRCRKRWRSGPVGIRLTSVLFNSRSQCETRERHSRTNDRH